VIVVAGDDQHFAIAAQRAAQLSEHRLGAAEGGPERPVAQLENVAEQHEPVDSSKGIQERRSVRPQAQDVGSAEPAQVQV
jgi:hypothetical protein